jgi:LPS O-antigen subunit length determinant protein (WzzB/FepE family)
VLSSNPQSDAVKRFLTVLYSPDLARRLANDNNVLKMLNANGQLGRLGRLLGWKQEPFDYPAKVRFIEAELSKITFQDDKKTLATTLKYQSTDRDRALNFLKVATKQGDEILRQYNLSEIAYDDVFLNNAIANTQNVDVRLALSQNLVMTAMRKMEANRSEYFSIRTLGPVEAPLGPVWPRTNYVIGGMFLLGLLAGAILAFVRTYLRSDPSADDLD